MKIFLGALLGGIVAFVWYFVSWMVLPWHYTTTESFRNEEFVGWVMKENITNDGVYMIPGISGDKGSSTPDELKQNLETQNEAMKRGPLVFSIIRGKGIDMESPAPYIYSFFIQFVGAGLISYLLKKGVDLYYFGRVMFCAFVGLTVGVLAYLPFWNWFGMPLHYTLVNMADLVIAWFLAGLLIAGVVRPEAEPQLKM